VKCVFSLGAPRHFERTLMAAQRRFFFYAMAPLRKKQAGT
jgi:hypothetical protein